LADQPFLFVGHGFGTSYKCLECFIWFSRAPSVAQKRKIRALLPRPLTSFAKFAGDLLHFGSDDALEAYVKAAYEAPFAKKPFEAAVDEVNALAEAAGFAEEAYFPKTSSWRAFCKDFERAMREIDRVAKIELVVKPDDGEDKRGAWHKASVIGAYKFAEHALRTKRKPINEAAYLTINVCESLAFGSPARIPPRARKAWLRWLDVLRRSGPRDCRDEFAECAENLSED